MSCDLITSTSACHIMKTTADRVNFSSVPKTRENITWKQKKYFFSSSILRQSNDLLKFWLGFISLLLLFNCTSLNEVKMVMIFDMLNSRNPFAKGYKASVTRDNIFLLLKQCDKVLSYLLSLKDQRQKLLIEGHHKTIN